MGEKLTRILPKVATSTSLLSSFTCCKFTTWDRRLYFPSEGRRAEYFFPQDTQLRLSSIYRQNYVVISATYFLLLKSRDFLVILHSANIQVIKAAHVRYVHQSQFRCWHHRCGVTAYVKDLNLTRNSNISALKQKDDYIQQRFSTGCPRGFEQNNCYI